MGYIEDLHDKCLAEFKSQLESAKEKNPNEYMFEVDFSALSFSYGLISGLKMLHVINRLIKNFQNAKRQTIAEIDKKCSTLDFEMEQFKALPDNQKREFRKNIKRDLLCLVDEYCEKIKKLKIMKRNILLRISNVILYISFAILFFGFGSLLYINNSIVSAIVYPVSIIALLCFVMYQILYAIKYLKAIKSTIHGVIDYSLKKAFTTLLMIWWYISILTFVNDWNVRIITYSFSAIFVLNIVSVIYDLFLSSTFFDASESILSLIAAIVIGFVVFADIFEQQSISQIGSVFLLLACLLLTMLIIKKFLIDKHSIKTMLDIIYFTFITFLTVIFTIVALFRLLWVVPKDGQVADNTLFSAVMGIYAALLGGGLTLAGVAWTIRKSDIDRKIDETSKFKPVFWISNNKDIRKPFIFSQLIKEFAEILQNGSNNWISITNFSLQNSDKTAFFIYGFLINEKFYKPNIKFVVNKDEIVRFFIQDNHIEQLNNFCIIVEDLIGNLYKFALRFNNTNEHVVEIFDCVDGGMYDGKVKNEQHFI